MWNKDNINNFNNVKVTAACLIFSNRAKIYLFFEHNVPCLPQNLVASILVAGPIRLSPGNTYKHTQIIRIDECMMYLCRKPNN